jgi:ribonuclease T2
MHSIPKALVVVLALVWASALRAQDVPAGAFDYYLLSLGWSSNWCAREGDDRDDPQCEPDRGFSWTVHGLWPQNETGWPSYCRTSARDPSRAETAAMADIMGGAGLAWYQWKKHGRCAGLSAPDYFSLMRQALAGVRLPEVFEDLPRDIELPARVVEDAFLEANPGLSRDQITVTCSDGMIQEVRLCLTRDLQPRRCGADVIRDCRLPDAVMEAVR